VRPLNSWDLSPETSTTRRNADTASSRASVKPGFDAQYRRTIPAHRRSTSESRAVDLPGGYVFVPVNLLLATRSEGELSGMLAHAIAHIEARHGTRQATRARVTNLTPARVVFVRSPTAADESLFPSGLLNLEQSFEKQADLVAVAIMTKVGYDPEALASYVARLLRTPSGWSYKVRPFFRRHASGDGPLRVAR
jgi:predicted Zn-dependent protease